MAYYPFSPQLDSIYTLQSGSLKAVFNDPFDADYGGMLTEVSGLDSPDIRESAEDLVEGDGGVHGNFYFGRRPITLNGRVFGHATARERDLVLDRVNNASLAMRSDSILSWVPRNRSANFVRNPRGVGGTTNWTAAATSGSSGAAATGAYNGVQLTSTLNTAGHIGSLYETAAYSYVDPRGATVVPAQPKANTSVVVQAALTVTSAPASSNALIRIKARCLDSAGTYLGEITAATYTLTTTSTGVVPLSGSIPFASLPANTDRVVWMATVTAVSATGTFVARFDQMGLDIRTDSLIPVYVDGASGGYWWGDTNASPSGSYVPQEISLRRQQPLRVTGPWVKEFQLQMVAENPLILSPITRTTRVNIGDFKFIENLGNAPYYPLVEVWGPLNYWSTILGSGGTVQVINQAYLGTGFTTATRAGTIDMLKHTFKEDNGNSFDRHINWSQAVNWPKVDPRGAGSWNLTNGTSGPSTGGYIIVKSRDAWL